MTDSEFLAWLAGFFDGEGSVGLYLNGRAFSAKATIVNTDRAVLEVIQMSFGGTLRQRKNTGRPVYTLVMGGSTAETMLRAIRPYTLVKSAQIDVFMEARRRLVGERVTDDELIVRRGLARKISALKTV